MTEHETNPGTAGTGPDQHELLPPDAAARDAARREEAGTVDEAIDAASFHFFTRNVSDVERAAAVAVLTRIRAEETAQVRRVERRELQPWARSQRVPEGFGDLMIEP